MCAINQCLFASPVLLFASLKGKLLHTSKNISTTLPFPNNSHGMCSSNNKEELPEIFYYHKMLLLFERYVLTPVLSKDLMGIFFPTFTTYYFKSPFENRKAMVFLEIHGLAKKCWTAFINSM